METSMTVILLTAAGFLALVTGMVSRRKLAARFTGAATLLAAAGGFFAYGYGFSQQNPYLPLAVVRSVLAALGMFLGRNDFSAVSGTALFSSGPAQAAFWLIHLLALYATASAALTTIGAEALRRLRLLLIFRNDLDLVFGVDEDTVAFGKKLLAQGKRHTLVFVDSSVPSGLAGEIAGMGGVLFSNANAIAPDLRFLRSVGMRPGKRRLTAYAMDKDPAQNLQFAQSLRTALEERGVAPGQTDLVLFGAEDTDADFLQALGERYGYGSVTVFDDAALAARLLMRAHPPCGAVDFDADGRAMQDFEALVVGFGQVGQAVLRHLVMQGQFEGSHFRLAVFSPDCAQVNGALTRPGGLAERYDITFHPFDARGPELYRYLDLRRAALRYVVVCTGDAKRNREIAGAMARQLIRLHSPAAVYQCSYQGFVRYSSGGTPAVQKGIYTPEVLSPKALDAMAMAINQCYCAGNGLDTEANWARCDYFSRLSSRASADFIPAQLRAAGRTREQVLREGFFLTPAQLENLGRTEHLRWCAFHVVMGFEPMSPEVFRMRCDQYRAQKEARGSSSLRIGKDMDLRLHACLVPWDELDALSEAENAVTGGSVDYKSMDRNNVLIVPQALKAGLAEGGGQP